MLGAPGKPAVLSRSVWDRPRYALRDERFKFLFDTRTGEERLFDLETDPGESRDVAAGGAAARRPTTARRSTRGRCASLGAGPADPRAAELTCEQCENLRALGYIQGDCSRVCK